MQSIIIIIPTKVGSEGITSTLMNITDKERGNRMPSKPQVIYEDKDFNNTLDLLSRLKIQCLAQQSVSPSKAEEIIKATEHLWTRYRCHGDKINEGYGCESCNYAARYLAENTDDQIKFMIMEKGSRQSRIRSAFGQGIVKMAAAPRAARSDHGYGNSV